MRGKLGLRVGKKPKFTVKVNKTHPDVSQQLFPHHICVKMYLQSALSLCSLRFTCYNRSLEVN